MNKPRYDKNLFKALGQAVTNRRMALTLSQEALGARMNADSRFVMELEGGLRNLNLGTLAKVSKALDYSLSQLLSETEALMDSGRASA
jgi:transcriptional regulator with XRE-family HTH domain